MKNKFVSAILVALFALLPLNLTEGKGFSSSGSRGFSSGSRSFSSSGSRSFSSSGSSRSSTPSRSFSSSGSSSSSSGKSFFSGWSSSSSKPKPSTNTNSSSSSTKSAFDVSQARRSIAPPPPPMKSKTDYVSDFKAKNESKYPSTFNTVPTQRPTYIPPVTNYGGKDRNVEYNPQTRSYGFFDDLGKFMVYDAITDIALDAFKKDEKVYVQQVEAHKKDVAAVEAKEKADSSTGNFIMVAFLALVGICFVGFVGYLFTR